MEKVIRIGIIGCGGIANGKHMPALKTIEGVEMVAFCDIIKERAEKAAKEYGVEGAKVYEDYKEFLKDALLPLILLKRASMLCAKSPWRKHMPKQRLCAKPPKERAKSLQ